jgi:hypothetical protein
VGAEAFTAVAEASTLGAEASTVDMVVTDGTAEVGAMDGAVGDGVLALGGRIGVGDGDTRMATATALRITLPTLTITRSIVLLDTHVLPMGVTTTRHHQILAQNPGATQQGLRDHRLALQTRTTRTAMSSLLLRVPIFFRLTR